MASNITQIGDVVGNLSLNFTNINTSNLLHDAITQTNEASNGLIGIVILIMLCGSILIYLLKFKGQFSIFDNFGLIFSAMLIWLDLSIYLVIFGILQSLQIFIFIYTCFFVLAFISLMKKELINTET